MEKALTENNNKKREKKTHRKEIKTMHTRKKIMWSKSAGEIQTVLQNIKIDKSKLKYTLENIQTIYTKTPVQ